MKKDRRYIIVATCIIALTLFAGCSSAKTEEVKEETVASVIEEENEVEHGIETQTKLQDVAEAVVDEIEESAEDLYIPEGIDMESTLPGEEWVASFVGKVTEPVVVIYNDNTGRKEVVQVGSKVIVNPDEDIFAIYLNEINRSETTHAISIKDVEWKDYYHLLIMDSEKMRSIPERNAKVTVRGGGLEEWVLEFTIFVE